MDQDLGWIKKESEELISKLGFDGEGIVVREEETVIVNFQVDDPAMLIGKGGDVLDSLQHVLRIMLARRFEGGSVDIVVDVAGYRSKKAALLTKRAKDKAFQVLATGIEEIMPPMSSYERMIVHTTCSKIADIDTESTGSGKERRVVIKPKRNG